ncbi:MAG: hypothetical protein ACRDUB_01595 [Mycobacterium sp.]
MRFGWVPVVAALAAGAVIGAPAARAAGADAVIADLEAQGYIVNINWVNGYNTKPLAYCTVVAVNNPDHSGAPPAVGDAVYVDVRCPNEIDGESGGEFGIGILFG